MRPPIIVIMGHIDHGKTTLLDTIRKTKVAEKESGGITQHMGAYVVDHKGRKMTFLDTPGHEMFSKMRSRGARVADFAVLVIAADEGVKPQTRESIQMIQESGIPFLVAFNKIDKPDANPERVKGELAKENVLVESYGGKIPSVDISAKEGKNIDDLLETLILMADLENLEGHPEKQARGVVVEAYLDPRRGPTATLLVQEGTLRKEEILAVGRALESIKIMEDFQGHPIHEAGASAPLRVSGLSQTPVIGEIFSAFPDRFSAELFLASLPPEEEAHGFAEKERPDAGRPIFHVILKADVSGSLEALFEAIRSLDGEMMNVHVLTSGVGDISEFDVKRALATKMVTIVGFRVGIDGSARDLSERSNIHIVQGDVIYDVLEKTKRAAEKIIPPEITRTTLGKVKIFKLFSKDGTRQIIGGRVEEGVAKKGARARLSRGKETVGEGMIRELQREKNPVDEVKQGHECGILFDARVPVQEGDMLEMFEEEIKTPKL